MKKLACMNSCVFNSLRELMREHFSVVLVAGVFGAFFALAAEGSAWVPLGAGLGILLAIVYGYIPRMTDCAGACPVQ
jgi:hypothetical protein